MFKLQFAIIQIEFSAAFHLINHNALLFKLQSLGFGRFVLGLAQDLLTGMQHVVVDGVLSKLRPILSRVPKGSVLGPPPPPPPHTLFFFFLFFFNIHACDLVVSLENKIVQYVEDTSLVHEVVSTNKKSTLTVGVYIKERDQDILVNKLLEAVQTI